MSEKQYRFTTKTHDFESDNVGLDYLKEENGFFYARENKESNWSKLTKLEQRSSISEWCDNNYGWVLLLGGMVWVGVTWMLAMLIKGFNLKSDGGLLGLWVLGGPFLIGYIFGLIGKQLEKLPSYFKTITSKEIKNIIEHNKRLTTLGDSSSAYKGISGEGSVSSSSRSSGERGAGSSSVGRSYVSPLQLETALNDLEAKGINWGDLVNNKTETEREKLFVEYFGNKDQGVSASERFNKEDVWPSRKAHLKKLIEDGDYENESDKQQLSEKLNAWGEEMTNDNFQKFAREIKNFTEKKQRKENHIKYEGRLSNKAIQSIKEYHGYICMGCGLDPVAEYGESMKGILEAHHKKPWAEIENEQTREVNANDFFVLCPNCHKMIHKLDQPDSLDELKEILNPPRKISWWD
ncbi:MAG: hypothetical protein R8M70_02315 [Alphaproteobacteria bacterium]|nr:hypothetical protein [Alphaproteobacteria bacterium]